MKASIETRVSRAKEWRKYNERKAKSTLRSLCTNSGPPASIYRHLQRDRCRYQTLHQIPCMCNSKTRISIIYTKSRTYLSSDSPYLGATYLYSLSHTRRLMQVDMKSTIFLLLSLWRGVQHAQAAAVFAHFMVKALQPRSISQLTSSTPGI